MNDYDRDALEHIRSLIWEYQDDEDLSEEVSDVLDEIFDIVDDFIRDNQEEEE